MSFNIHNLSLIYEVILQIKQKMAVIYIIHTSNLIIRT